MANEYDPVGHELQVEAPLEEKVPDGQNKQLAELDVLAYVPGEHFVHEDAPTAVLKLTLN